MVEAVVGLLRHSRRKWAESERGQSRERRKLSRSPPHLRRRRRASEKVEKVVCATTSTSERREPPRWRPRGSEEGGVAGRVGASLVCAIWNPRAGLDFEIGSVNQFGNEKKRLNEGINKQRGDYKKKQRLKETQARAQTFQGCPASSTGAVIWCILKSWTLPEKKA